MPGVGAALHEVGGFTKLLVVLHAGSVIWRMLPRASLVGKTAGGVHSACWPLATERSHAAMGLAPAKGLHAAMGLPPAKGLHAGRTGHSGHAGHAKTVLVLQELVGLLLGDDAILHRLVHGLFHQGPHLSRQAALLEVLMQRCGRLHLVGLLLRELAIGYGLGQGGVAGVVAGVVQFIDANAQGVGQQGVHIDVAAMAEDAHHAWGEVIMVRGDSVRLLLGELAIGHSLGQGGPESLLLRGLQLFHADAQGVGQELPICLMPKSHGAMVIGAVGHGAGVIWARMIGTARAILGGGAKWYCYRHDQRQSAEDQRANKESFHIFGKFHGVSPDEVVFVKESGGVHNRS